MPDPYTAPLGATPTLNPHISQGGEALWGQVRQTAQQAHAATGQFHDTEVKRELADVQSNAAMGRAELHQLYQQYIRTADPDDPDYTFKFTEIAQGRLDKLQDRLTTKQGKRAHEDMVAGLMGEYVMRTDLAQVNALGDKAVTKFTDSVNVLSNILVDDPDQFGRIMAEQTKALAMNENLTTEQRSAVGVTMRQDLAKAAIHGIAMRSPEQARRELVSGAWDPFLKSGDKPALFYKFTSEMYADQNRALAAQKNERKIKGDEYMRDIYLAAGNHQLGWKTVSGAAPWLEPSDLAIALRLLETNDLTPDKNDRSTVGDLELQLISNPQDAIQAALKAHKEGRINTGYLSSFTDRARSRSRQEGFKSQYEDSTDYLKNLLAPAGLLDDPADKARFGLAVDEFRTWYKSKGADWTDDEIDKKAKDLAVKWARFNVEELVRKTSVGAKAVDTTDVAGQLEALKQEARQVQSAYEANDIDAEMYRKKLQEMKAKRDALIRMQNAESSRRNK